MLKFFNFKKRCIIKCIHDAPNLKYNISINSVKHISKDYKVPNSYKTTMDECIKDLYEEYKKLYDITE